MTIPARSKSESDGPKTAHVELLTAKVRVLMVGSRQVTLSVYRQLDNVEPEDIEAFGRTADSRDGDTYLYVIGRDRNTGALVRSGVRPPRPRTIIIDKLDGPESRDYFHCWRPVDLEPPTEKGWDHRLDGIDFYVNGRMLIAERKGYLAVVEIRRAPVSVVYRGQSRWKFPQDDEPWYWEYASDDAREELTNEADISLGEAITGDATFREWKALPLIVLAGLH